MTRAGTAVARLGRIGATLTALVAAVVLGLLLVTIALYGAVRVGGDALERWCDAHNDCADVGR